MDRGLSGVTDQIAHVTCIMPTIEDIIVDYGGVPSTNDYDGISIKHNLLYDQIIPLPDGLAIGHKERVMILGGDFKCVINTNNGNNIQEVYNLRNDAYEDTNFANTNPNLANSFKQGAVDIYTRQLINTGYESEATILAAEACYPNCPGLQ